MLRVRTAMYTQFLNTDNRVGNVGINIFLNKFIMNIVTCINCHTEFGEAKEIEMYIRCECGTDIVNDEGYENAEPLYEEEPEWRGWLNQMTARQAAYHNR